MGPTAGPYGISIAWLVDRDTDATRHVIDFAASALARLARRVDHVAA
jgi:hypothetical protein